jgi:hypothetical protein
MWLAGTLEEAQTLVRAPAMDRIDAAPVAPEGT